MGGVFLPCRSGRVVWRVGAAAAVPAISGFAVDPALRSVTVRWVKRVLSVRCVVFSEPVPDTGLFFFDVLAVSR